MTRAFWVGATICWMSAAQAEILYVCEEDGRKTFRSSPCKASESIVGKHEMDRYAGIGPTPVPSQFPRGECRPLSEIDTYIECLRRRYNRAVAAQDQKEAAAAKSALEHARATKERAARTRALSEELTKRQAERFGIQLNK